MPTEDNVVKMPDRLERRGAQKIEAAMMRRTKGDEEWIEGTLELAAELIGARDELKADQAFGKWFDDRFRSNAKPQISKDERAILIREGRDLDQMRIALEKAEGRSLRGIFTTNSKDPTQSPGGPKLREAKDKILAYEAVEGKLPPADRHFKMPDITPSTYDRAIREVRSARAQAETLGPLKLTKATAVHIRINPLSSNT